MRKKIPGQNAILSAMFSLLVKNDDVLRFIDIHKRFHDRNLVQTKPETSRILNKLRQQRARVTVGRKVKNGITHEKILF